MPKGFKMRIKAADWKLIVIRALLKKHHGICELCDNVLGDELVEVDHVIEKKCGGIDDLENLRIVHLVCHKRRHQKVQKMPDASIPLHGIKAIRRSADLEIVAALRQELIRNGNWKIAAEKIGLTVDQARYLKVKHNLGKDYTTWFF